MDTTVAIEEEAGIISVPTGLGRIFLEQYGTQSVIWRAVPAPVPLALVLQVLVHPAPALLAQARHTGALCIAINVAEDGIPVKNMMMKLFESDIKLSPGQYFEGFKILKTIGEGKYGICYLIADGKNLRILKQLKKKMLHEDPLKAHYEGDILKSLKHEAIPELIRKIENKHFSGYVLEYKQGITLEAAVFEQRHVFTRAEIYNIGKQLINILIYMHGKGVVHRDIRLPNVLLNDNRIYLVDFGAARWIDNKKYKEGLDFFCLGDLLIHLYYTSFIDKPKKEKPWFEELVLSSEELLFLKRLMEIESSYESINELEAGFEKGFGYIKNR